ncbi:MAG: GTPase [Candidatus Heimdallarchaeaceae archaeon]
MPKKRDYSKIVRRMIYQSDVVCEVIDGRFPSLSRVKKYEQMVERYPKKSLVIAMNKIDLVPDRVVKRWVKILKEEGLNVLAVSARERLSTSLLRKELLEVAPPDVFYVTACFIGLPNTGKSSLINILKGRSSAPVAPIPGYTRSEQVLRITTRLRIFDTPGVLTKSIEPNERILLGTYRWDQLADHVKASWVLVQGINKHNPNILKEVYGIDYDSPEDFIRKFAEKRNRRKKGGVLDIEAAASIFMNEYIVGKIPIWEDPEKYLQTKAEVE